MHQGALIVFVLVLLQGVSAQVTVSSFDVPISNLKAGVFDQANNVYYFFRDSNPTTLVSVSLTSQGLVTSNLPRGLSVTGIKSALLNTRSGNLYVTGTQGVGAFNVFDSVQYSFLATRNPAGVAAFRHTEDAVADKLLFFADVPPTGSATTVYLVESRTLTVIHSILLPAADGNVTTIFHDDKREYLYLGTNAAPFGRIVRVSAAGRKLRRLDHLELPVNVGGVTTGFLDASRDAAFFAISTPRSQIIKVDLASWTRTHVFDAPGTPVFGQAINLANQGYSLWISATATPPVAYRFESCNFKLVDQTILPAQPFPTENAPQLVFATGGQTLLRVSVAGGVVCPDKDAFRRVATRKDSCLVDVRAGVTDPIRNKAYFVTNTPHSNVLQVDLSSASLNVTKIYKLSGGYGRAVAVDVQRGRLYVGLNEASSGQLVKLDISDDPHVIGTKALIHGASSIVFDNANNLLYVCTNPKTFGQAYGVIHKIDAESLDVIETLNLAPEDDGCNVLLHDPMRGALYVGTASYPARIIKLTTKPFARESFIQLNSQYNQTTTGFIDSAQKFAYFGTWLPYGAIIKVNIDTFTFVDIFSPVGIPGFTASLDDPTHGVSYWFTNELPGAVHRIRMCDFSYLDSFKLRRNEEVPYAATLSAAGGLVLATGTKVMDPRFSTGVCGSILQLQPSKCADCPPVPDKLTRVATALQQATTAKDVRAGVVDYHTGAGYFVTYTIPAAVLKVDLVTLALQDKLVLTNNLGRSAAVDGVKRKAYFGMGTNPGSIVKVDLQTFSVENIVSARHAVRALAYDEYAGVLYAGTSAPLGTRSVVHKINGLTLEVISTVELDVKDGPVRTIQLDIKRGYLYVGTGSSPARIVRLKMNRFDRINFIEFPFGYNEIETSVFDNDRAIFSISKPHARLITLGFDGFKWQETLTFTGVKPFTTAVTDPINGYSYWFTDEVPSNAYRIRMCNFEKADMFPLRDADEVPRAAVYGSGKITVGTSCALTDADNTCGLDHRLSFFQLQGGGQAKCVFDNPAPQVTQTIINSTLVSLRFNFQGMIPPVRYCNATN